MIPMTYLSATALTVAILLAPAYGMQEGSPRPNRAASAAATRGKSAADPRAPSFEEDEDEPILVRFTQSQNSTPYAMYKEGGEGRLKAQFKEKTAFNINSDSLWKVEVTEPYKRTIVVPENHMVTVYEREREIKCSICLYGVNQELNPRDAEILRTPCCFKTYHRGCLQKSLRHTVSALDQFTGGDNQARTSTCPECRTNWADDAPLKCAAQLYRDFLNDLRGPALVEGDIVEAEFHNMWYPAKITKVNPDDTYNVEWIGENKTSSNLERARVRRGPESDLHGLAGLNLSEAELAMIRGTT